MAKKDLSKAAGLDALFRRPTLPVEDESTSALPKAKPKEQVKIEKSPPPPEEKIKAKVKKKPVSKAVETVAETVVQEASPKPKPPVKRESPKKQASNVFSVNLEGIRKTKTEYTGIRLKRELFERLGDIAKKEKVKSTNSLISKVLEAFCDGYEGNQ